MANRDISANFMIEKYIKGFGSPERFTEKIITSLHFPFNIINVDSLETEISNMEGFSPGIKCYDLCYGRKEKCDNCIVDLVVKKRKKICIDRDGTDIFAVPIFGEGGRVVSIIKYWMEREKVEVVKEKIVEKMSTEQQETFYNILQNSHDVVYRYDFLKGRFEYVSESVYTLLGFSLGEFIDMRYDDFLARVHPDDVGEPCDCGKNGECETTCTREYRWKCKDGKYRWFLDYRTWFFDENGRRLCVIGNIKDITNEKEKEKEVRELEEQIALIKKKERESNERIALTDKEKVVLWGLCHFPLLNDEELSKKLELKRSTLTAIKNRLKGKRWFSLKYIPNFSKLGCQIMGVIDGKSGGKVKPDLNSLKESPNVIFTNYQDEKFFGIFVSNEYVKFKKFLETFEDNNKESLKNKLKENGFFCGLEDFEFRDFSGIINSLFGLKRKENPNVYNFEGAVEELNISEKRVLHAMIKDPDLSSSEIAKKIWVSKPTVIKVRNRLIEDGFLYPVVVPDFRKLGLGYFGRLCYEFDSDLPEDIRNKRESPNVLFSVKGKKKIVKFVLYASEDEYNQEVDLEKEVYHKKGFYFVLDSEVFAMQKRGKGIVDLEPFINELFFNHE